MRTRWLTGRVGFFGIGLFCVGLLGCENSTVTKAAAKAAVSASPLTPVAAQELALVPHPEYVHWNRFPVGAGVVRNKEVTSDFGKVRVTTTVRLVKKTPENVVIESQVMVDRGEGSPVENPPLKMEFPATFRLPPSMQVEQFALPALKAKLQGKESRTACEREFQTELFTWNEVNEAGPMAVKFWRTDEIPGRMLRQEINGHNHVSVEEVTEITGKE